MKTLFEGFYSVAVTVSLFPGTHFSFFVLVRTFETWKKFSQCQDYFLPTRKDFHWRRVTSINYYLLMEKFSSANRRAFYEFVSHLSYGKESSSPGSVN